MIKLLSHRIVEKPWGQTLLPPPFGALVSTQAQTTRPVGEIWFEPPGVVQDLLVKYIFAREKLSVQVHPSDAQTRAAGLGRQGKEECWLVIDAEPGARLGIGFSADLDQAAMRSAVADGTIETLLTWHEVATGDFFYIPANTVHAIGAGICVLEVQQYSDITYRLYDYGRPRELHVEAALAVADGHPYDRARYALKADGPSRVLVDGPHFRLVRIVGRPLPDVLEQLSGPVLAIPLAGCYVDQHGGSVTVGQCALIENLGDIVWDLDGICLMATLCAPRDAQPG